MIRILTVERFRVARFPSDVAFWLKALLLAILAVQLARLIWAGVTPVGPLGDWRLAGVTAISPAAQAALIAAVNPFDRMAASEVVSSLPSDLKLFGVRASGGVIPGGAIVGLPDGQQISVSVGEPVMPGVLLVAVGFDYAEVDRQGSRQRLFMDQDKPAETLGARSSSAVPQAAKATALTVEAVRAAVSFSPRQSETGLTGITVVPGSDQAIFAAIGFKSGDVIVAVNGARIASAADVAQLQQSLTPGSSLALTVDRGGQQIPITLSLAKSR